ncbi:hypothetical protein [Nonomuraea guangzhouensis]|uniref:Uncharacterized protein n=1 Tax=Nonomuraea guangzhouensis TaxID=1291555 RepID=A0ABW4G7U9_9ACTN|nr:hypothetical protein [Nonomuraea guangzhouensis]
MSKAADKSERSGHARALAGTPTWAFTPGVNAGALAHILVELAVRAAYEDVDPLLVRLAIARSVRCCGNAPRDPPVARSNDVSRRAAISSIASILARAAVSSMAGGMPSSRWHTSATGIAFSAVSGKPGSTAATRSTSRRTAS